MEMRKPDESASPTWAVKVSVPFDWQWSKNRMWIARADTYARRLSDHARSRRDLLVFSLRAELKGRRVANNVLIVWLHVELPDHKGDAINCIDLVCDAIEIATGLDDRWYGIGGLTWGVVKQDPQLTVTIGQFSAEDVQICGTCGSPLPLDFFGKGTNKLGKTTTCRDCLAARRRQKKKPRTEPCPGPDPFPGTKAPWKA